MKRRVLIDTAVIVAAIVWLGCFAAWIYAVTHS